MEKDPSAETDSRLAVKKKPPNIDAFQTFISDCTMGANTGFPEPDWSSQHIKTAMST